MGLEAISSPPAFISREEHTSLTSSTPASFGDIPPVLRFNDQVEITLSTSDSASASASGSVNVDGRIRGQIWVTELNVAFLPEASGQGFKLDYQSLTLHALTPASGDVGAHLYCQIDDSPASAGSGAANGGMEDEEEFGEMRELRVFVAEGKLSPLFEALSDCSALHDSLLPSGETSSFPFFPPGGEDDDEEEWEEDDERANGNGNGNGGGDGRVHSSAGSGHILIDFAASGRKAGKEKKHEEGDEEIDQMERFLNLVEWGSIPKPDGWEAAETRAFEDAEEEQRGEGQVEDIDALAKRLGATELVTNEQNEVEDRIEEA